METTIRSFIVIGRDLCHSLMTLLCYLTIIVLDHCFGRWKLIIVSDYFGTLPQVLRRQQKWNVESTSSLSRVREGQGRMAHRPAWAFIPRAWKHFCPQPGTTKNLNSGSSRLQEKNCQVRTWSCPTHSQRPSKTSQGLCFPMKWGSSPNQHCKKVRRQKVEGLALGKWVQDEVAGRTESVSRDDILSVQSSPCTCTSFLALYLWYSVLKAYKPWWHTQSIRHRSQSTMYIPDTSSAFNVLLHPWYSAEILKRGGVGLLRFMPLLVFLCLFCSTRQ